MLAKVKDTRAYLGKYLDATVTWAWGESDTAPDPEFFEFHRLVMSASSALAVLEERLEQSRRSDA